MKNIFTVIFLFCLPLSLAFADQSELTFSATIERIAGIADSHIDPTFAPGQSISGNIIIDDGKRVPMSTGEGYMWLGVEGNKPTGHLLINSPFSSEFRHAFFIVQKSPGGKVAINCGSHTTCETNGTLESTDGEKWKAFSASLQAPFDIADADYDVQGAIQLLQNIVNQGGTKMLLRFSDAADSDNNLRVILSVDSIVP